MVSEVYDRLGERAPTMIGFGADEKENVAPVRIGTGSEFERWPRKSGIDAVEEMHNWPSRTVIEEGIGVEDSNGHRVEVLKDRAKSIGSGEASIDPSIESEDQCG
jgi:hypothetical protein